MIFVSKALLMAISAGIILAFMDLANQQRYTLFITKNRQLMNVTAISFTELSDILLDNVSASDHQFLQQHLVKH